MTRIHPTAIIDPNAELDPSVEVGPFAFIEAGVKIGPNTTIGPYVHIQGLTEIGPDNKIGTGCTLGHAPQHTGYTGAPTRLKIGSGNVLREYVSIHRAFKEGDATVVGNNCFLMGFSHVGHDCEVQDGVILANSALLAGHVSVGSRAFISGNAGVHQFCRIGRLVMVGGGSAVNQDIPPYMIAEGRPALVRSLNTIGISRAGFGPELRTELKRLYRALYRAGKTVRAAIAEIDVAALKPELRELVEFHTSASKRGITPFAPYRRDRSAEAE
jgi:UDP-N-acetylglucosamine acyltransferase